LSWEKENRLEPVHDFFPARQSFTSAVLLIFPVRAGFRTDGFSDTAEGRLRVNLLGRFTFS